MGNLSPELAIAVMTGTVAIVTGLWHAAMYVGKLTVKVDRHEDRLNQHESKLDDHDHEFRFLKGLPR
jgi:hypothetical protein